MDILGTLASFAGNFFSGGFLGLLGSIAPMIIHYFQSRQDDAHELAMRNLDIEAAKAAGAQKIEEIGLQGDVDALTAAINAQARPSGVKWVDALSSFIRPFLTLYWCVVVFTAAKIVQLIVLIGNSPDTEFYKLILQVWFGPFEQQIIGAMFVYWFTPRVFGKLKIGKA